MRCMTCGDEMVLADAVPAVDIGVQGFEHQTFQCPGCDDTECRLVFTDRPTVFARRRSETAVTSSEPCEIEQVVAAPPISNAPDPETVCAASNVEALATEEQASEGEGLTDFASEVAQSFDPPVLAHEAGTSAGINISVPAWVRAIEKLRTHQADLHQRQETKKTNWNAEFDKAWDYSLAAPARNQSRYAAQPRTIAPWGGESLSPRALTVAGNGCSQSPEPAQEADSEAARPFNGFWESRVPSHSPQPTPLAALPAAPNLAATEAEDAPQAVTGGKYLLNAFEKLINAVQAAVPSRSFF
jgi:hypothetical protein